MPGCFRLEWKDGRHEDYYGGRGYYYVLPDKSVMAMHPMPAWCHHCGKVTLCENLRPIADTKSELDRLGEEAARVMDRAERSDAKYPSLRQIEIECARRFPEHKRRQLIIELRHADARQLPQSCLECGERRISHFKDGEWAPHPTTGEMVRFSCWGMCSTAFVMQFYDLECRRIPMTEEETKAMAKILDRERI